jgi:3-methyladenine DNA glycosylase Mpg
MKQSVLRVGQKGTGEIHSFQIAEIEFYVNDYDKHDDSFTNGDKAQTVAGKWYFWPSHMKKSGLEFTLGSVVGVESCGGVLIKSIMPIDTEEKLDSVKDEQISLDEDQEQHSQRRTRLLQQTLFSKTPVSQQTHTDSKQNLKPGQLISGSRNVIKTLLTLAGVETIADL